MADSNRERRESMSDKQLQSEFLKYDPAALEHNPFADAALSPVDLTGSSYFKDTSFVPSSSAGASFTSGDQHASEYKGSDDTAFSSAGQAQPGSSATASDEAENLVEKRHALIHVDVTDPEKVDGIKPYIKYKICSKVWFCSWIISSTLSHEQ